MRLGALKLGFAAGKRDLLGLDGAFMKGPFHGQILSIVALSSAIIDLFPCHIHDNMRSRWGGDEFKELLWNCSTAWRAYFDVVINNICECFNSTILEGCDEPIINCLEFISKYIMKRIVNVDKEIDKATGPLTPTATKILQKIKDEAKEYITSFCGNGKYQVNGPWQDQCVVNMNQRICSCKKWEITGMSSKHVAYAIRGMREIMLQSVL
uniref:Uncharacterized protein n=1 Tax=Lactuca sativa TaxID=4236 RepID=A0A9R1WV52_LACSA|nr:hypothetical protein LSAT_V11C900465280 [Lactuca sativa]